MDISFLLQLAIIFLPGIIWERIDAQFVQKRVPNQLDVLRRTFVFGLVSYIAVYGIDRLFDFETTIIIPSNKVITLDTASINQIVRAIFVAFILSILWLYFVKFNPMKWIVHTIHATPWFSREDLLELTFEGCDKEVKIEKAKYVQLRDFNKKLVYAGWVKLYWITETVLELVLLDVKVFDFEGNERFTTPRVYIARSLDDIDIEFPVQPERNQEHTDE